MPRKGEPTNDGEVPVRKTRTTFNLPGHAHELTFSCQGRLPLLNRDRTRQWFVDAVDAARTRHSFEIWAFVVMPEHAHVLIFPTKSSYDLTKILSAIKLPVARRAMRWLRAHSPDFLDRLRVDQPHGSVEHRFWLPGGGYDRNIVKLDTAWTSVRYLHDNPVRRGLAPKATHWPWSSARQYAGRADVVLRIDDCPH